MFTKKKQKGIALVTTLFFLVMVTALATAAIMLATVQVKVSGSVMAWESALVAAEGGINYVIANVQSVHYTGTIPAEYAGTMSDITFANEINDPANRFSPDSVKGSPPTPDMTMTIGQYTVLIDIDTFGVANQAGGGIEASTAYHGGASSGSGLMSGYLIVSRASSPSGRTNAQMNQVLWLKTIM